MNELHFPLIELAILAPLVGAFLARRAAPDAARRIALAATAVALVASLLAWIDLAVVHAFEAHDRWTLLAWLPGGDPLVLDELSAPLLPLTALEFLLTILATLRAKAVRFSFALTLISESLVLATLATRTPWLITTLLAASAVPVAIELARRGAPLRVFGLHTALCVGLMAGGVALQAWGGPDWNPVATAAIAVAVLIRCAALPFQLWLIDLFDRASFGTAILYLTPMTGPYAALRLLLPEASPGLLRVVAAVSIATAVYAGGMALIERDARRAYAMLLLSHASLVLVGLELATLLGLTGALCVWLSVGLAMTGFGLTLRSAEARVGRLSLDRFNGLHDASPSLAGLFLLTGLAAIGFPGTVGFIAVELLVEGAVQSAPVIGVLVLVATALNGLALLRIYHRIFTGAEHLGTINLSIRPPERVAVLALAALILGGGVWPQLGVSSRRHAAEALLQQRARHLASGEHLTHAVAPGKPSLEGPGP